MEANHGPTIYDRVFSHRDAESHNEQDFEVIISRISGEIKASSQRQKDNPYRTSKIPEPKVDPQKTNFAYKPAYSSASETEDIMNSTATMPGRGRRKGRERNKS